MTKIKRIDEMWYDSQYFDFTAFEDTNSELRNGVTYCLHDNMEPGKGIYDWSVSVFVKDKAEEQMLKDFCYEGGVKRFNGGDEVYDYGKCEVDGYPKTVSVEEFISMFEDEEKGLHTLHNYSMRKSEKVEEAFKQRLGDEYRVCLIDSEQDYGKFYGDMSDDEFMSIAEQQGTVYSLEGYQEAFNNDEVSDTYWMRIVRKTW